MQEYLVAYFPHFLVFFRIEKALHEALIRQEELLAYVDSQEVARSKAS